MTPEEPLGDDDMTTSPAGAPQEGLGGGDADGTDGDATDGTDGDTTDADGTDADGTDADGTDADGDRRRRHGRRRDRRHRRGRVLSALDLLSGDAQTFLDKVWASRVHLHRSDPDELVGLLDLDDADHLLTSRRDPYPLDPAGARGCGPAGVRVHPPRDPRRPAALRAGRPAQGSRRLRRRCHDRLPGDAPLLAPADPPDRRARAGARPPVPGQRLPHPAGLAGLRRSRGHPRRVRLPDRRAPSCGRCTPRTGSRRCCSSRDCAMYLPTGTPHAARAQDDRLTARHPRHQPADLAGAGRAHGAAICSPRCPTTHLPAGYLEDPARSPTGSRRRLDAGRRRRTRRRRRPPPSRRRSDGS